MKEWSDQIRQHINNWSSQLGSLNWWPKFVYHFTDVQNAANILNINRLLCRNKADAQHQIIVDGASPTVIRHTKAQNKNYVRLYFRPLTPTQYSNEGIRPISERILDSHCPVPIFFCFDSFEVLSLDKTEFSNGNMGRSGTLHNGQQDFFQSIPFEFVFHHGAFTREMRDIIINYRHSEVLVPEFLELQHLKRVVCRTAAERQTLLHLLNPQSRAKWTQKIVLADRGFFERKWSYVEEVVVIGEQLDFRFNPNTSVSSEFNARFEYRDANGQQREWEGVITTKDNLALLLPNTSIGVAKLTLDDCLAFSDLVVFDPLPF